MLILDGFWVLAFEFYVVGLLWDVFFFRCRIAAARLEDSKRHLVDQFPFVAYHQYPPADRPSKTVAGMQFAENYPAPGMRITLLPLEMTTVQVVDGFGPESCPFFLI